MAYGRRSAQQAGAVPVVQLSQHPRLSHRPLRTGACQLGLVGLQRLGQLEPAGGETEPYLVGLGLRFTPRLPT